MREPHCQAAGLQTLVPQARRSRRQDRDFIDATPMRSVEHRDGARLESDVGLELEETLQKQSLVNETASLVHKGLPA